MTEAEASQIEAAFSLQIPPVWRALITDPAACEHFDNGNRTRRAGSPCVGLLLEYPDLKQANEFYRTSEHARPYWRPEWLAIHADGMGNVYFLDTLDPGPVFDFDHEKTFPGYNPRERPKFPTIEAFLAHIEEYELEEE